ncbi:MAG: amidohydrolase family protein [Candidatus Aminicenantaceae bacterium]
MNKKIHLFAILFLMAGVVFAGAGDKILIINGTIVPVTGKTIPGGSLLIEDGKITRISPVSIEAPEDAEIIDAEGKFVYPGMVALMTAVGVTGYPGAGTDMDEQGTVTPQMDPYDAVNPEDETIPVTRMGGVTTVMTVSGTRSPVNGKAVVLNLEGHLAEEMILKQHAGQIFNTAAKQRGRYPSTLPGVVALIEDKLEDARRYAARKDKPGKDEGEDDDKNSASKTDLVMEALVPVIKGEVTAFFLTSDEVSLRNALKIIEEYNLKAVIRAGRGVLKYAEELKKMDIPVIWAGTTAIPERWEPFDRFYHAAAVLEKTGVMLAFDPGGRGAESRNVRNLPVPASISVAHGLSRQAALEALTINPAKILGIDDQLGSLEEGKMANVVIWTGSPIKMTSRVETVIIKGKKIPMTSVQTRLRDKFEKVVKDRMKK